MQFRIGINLGDILSRDDGTIYGDGVNVAARLESLAEPGGIMISESARMQVRTLIDVGIADAGEHEVKNIAEPVHAYRIVLDESAMTPAPRRVSAILRRPVIAAAITVLVVAVGGFAIWFATHAPAPTTEAVTPSDPILALPTGPSIAVLPFENLSGDTTQDYFSDGITEDIISALSRFRSMFVIGKDSTIRYKGSQASAKDIGGDLGVEFVLQGSVRRSGDVIRISTRLINAKDGSVVWSNVFDRPLDAENVFAIQDEITEQVVATLAGTFGVLDQTRYADTSGEPSQNLASYECVLRAKKFYFTWAVEMFLNARACLEGVIETEPKYADAWA
jgi:adenylate cyclase